MASTINFLLSLFFFNVLVFPTSLTKLFVSAQPQTTLTPGRPYSDYAGIGSTNYYLLDISSSSGVQGSSVTINISPLGPGDPDVYASFTDVHPTAVSQFVSRAFGEDSISLTPDQIAGKTNLYIAVYGFRSVNYTITIDSNNPVTLVNGIPQVGMVHISATKYFYFQSSNRLAPFYINAVATTGSVSLYISNNAFPNGSPGSFNWPANSYTFANSFTIDPSDPLWPQSNLFYIAVVNTGDVDSSFTVYTGQNSTIFLRDGVPVSSSLTIASIINYAFLLSPNSGTSACAVVFSVTPLTGDPDLYSSHCAFNGGGSCISKPSPSSYEQRSIRTGADEIVYPSPAPPGIFYISVYAWRATSFTLQASTDCGGNHTIDFSYLIDGVPQSGTLSRGVNRYYKFVVQRPNSDVTFSVARRYGDPDLYVRTDDGIPPGPDSFQWKSTFAGEDMVTILKNDPKACTTVPCVYYISVYAFSDTSYSLTASTAATTRTLQAGVPFNDFLTGGSYEYFQFIYDQPGRPITVSVTDLGRGDPDLYISNVSPRPNITNYRWSSTRFSSDSITIPPTDPGACTGRCTYFVSVLAYSDTTFTLLASYADASALQDGVPQNSNVGVGETNYFYFDVSPGYGVATFTFTSTNGGLASLLIANNNTYPEPSIPSSYQFEGPWYLTSKTIAINENDSKACKPVVDAGNHLTCRYIVGVYAYSNTTYSLLAYTSTGNFAVALQNGVSQAGHLDARQWQYYTIRVDSPRYDLTLIVTALSGDPDIYVTNVTSNARVNATTAKWQSTRYGTDSIDIDNASIGTYYIGVYAYSANTSFTIVGLIQSDIPNDPSNRVSLVNGQPQQGSVHLRRYLYYSIYVPPSSTSLDISATKLFGDPDLYVTRPGDLLAPSISHYAYRATGGGSDLIHIPSPQSGYWTIAVYGYATSLFTILANVIGSQNSLIQLQDSIPFRLTLPAGVYQDFYITVNNYGYDLNVVVTSFGGDPDLYIATHPFPRSGNATWFSTNWLDDSITIPSTDVNSCENSQVSNFRNLCTFYISIYSFTPSSFALTASFSSVTYLQDGTPQTGAVSKGLFKYYAITPLYTSTLTSLTVSVIPLNGNPSLYISSTVHPLLTDYTDRAVGQYSGANIILTPSSRSWCIPVNSDGCIYYIGVYGETDTNYTVSVTSNAGSYMLQDGRPVRDFLIAGNRDYFAFDIQQPNRDLLIAVTPITGDPDLYVSTIYSHPNATANEYNSRSFGADAILIVNANVTRYYIAVEAYAGNSNSTFTITASTYSEANNTNDAQQLVDGVPQNGIVPTGVLRYFVFDLTGQHAEFTVSLSRSVGDPDLYISLNAKPTLSSYQWASTQLGQDIVTIYNPVPGRYWIAVYGFSTSDFAIVAKTSSSALALLNGIPFREDLQQGRWEYFVLPVDSSSLSSDLTITLTALLGDPDMYVSRIYERPNRTASEWRSMSYQSDAITIPSTKLITGDYYIGVTAFTNCSFIIQANFNSRSHLQDGAPQADSISKLQSKYYIIRLTNPLGANNRANNLTVTVTPTSGRVFVYMSALGDPVYGQPNTYSWSSQRPSASQTLVAKRTDAAFCTRSFCDYTIMVYGLVNAQYSLTASTDMAIIELQNGRPVQGNVALGGYKFYTFTALNPRAAITFTVTPSSGDPDLFVNPPCVPVPGQVCLRPTQSNYAWSSILYGGDAVFIDYDEPKFKTGTYSIAVYGAEASQYTLSAIITDLSSNSTLTYLIDGQQQTGFSRNSSDPKYYVYFVPPPNDSNPVTVSFTVTPRYGDPDLYVNVGVGSSFPTFPSASNYNWKSEEWGRDNIVVDNSCTNCYYLIAVQGFVKSLFDIVVTSGSTQLLSGVPHLARVVKGQYNYYYLSLDFPDDDLTISVTSLSGDPDIFVDDRDSVQKPNSTFYKWRGQDVGSDTISIVSPHQGYYYASVFGYSNSTYIITATVGPIYLVDSEPHADTLSIGDFRLYAYTYSVGGAISRPINVLIDMQNAGLVDFFVCNNCTIPSRTNYQWAVLSSFTVRNTLTILPTDPFFCPFSPCTYRIAVYPSAGSSRVKYSLTVSSEDIPQLLAEGIPVTAEVPQGQFKYFRAVIDDITKDFNIDVTEYVGNAIVAADWHSKPNSTSIWNSGMNPNSRGDHVAIAHIDPYFSSNAIPGRQIFISVYGVARTRFSIVTTTRSQLLLIGQPAIGTLDGSGNAHFAVNLDFNTSKVDIVFSIGSVSNNLNSLNPYHPLGMALASTTLTLYITNNGTSTVTPSASNYIWKKEMTIGSSFAILPSDHFYCSTCTHYMTIVGIPPAQFTFTVSTDDNIDTLFDNSVAQGNLPLSVYKYYEIYIAAALNFTVLVETCLGNADVFVSQSTRRPMIGNAEWSSTNKDDIDLILISTYISDKSFFIGVLGNGGSNPNPLSSYKITTRTSADPAAHPLVSDRSLTASSSAVNTIDLSFLSAVSARGSQYNKNLRYTVYYQIADNPVYAMYSECGLTQTTKYGSGSFFNNIPSTPSQLTIEVQNLDAANSYQINILVEDVDPSTLQVFGSSLYRVVSVRPLSPDSVNNSDTSTLRILLIVGIPVALLIIALAVYLFYKNRRLTQELSIEMGDVPKGVLAKAMRGPPSANKDAEDKKQKNYSRLLPDDDVDTADDYRPPLTERQEQRQQLTSSEPSDDHDI